MSRPATREDWVQSFIDSGKGDRILALQQYEQQFPKRRKLHAAKKAVEETKPQEEVAPLKRKRGRPPVDWTKRDKSPTQMDLFQMSLDIAERPASDYRENLGVMATAMIFASLPHSEVDGAIFKRKSGDVAISIINDPDIGLPYGKLPRLITAYLCTEAKRTLSPRISLGKSKSEFAKRLGLTTGGGPQGDLNRLHEQCKRLFTSKITLTSSPNSTFQWSNVSVTDEGLLLWDIGDKDARQKWHSELVLTNRFFNECVEHSVPIDLRVISKLRSPLAIDIYIWLTYRYNSISGLTHISWKQLKWQFGSNYASDDQGLRNFVSEFKKQLRNINALWPEAKFSADRQTFILLPSKPHVKPVYLK